MIKQSFIYRKWYFPISIFVLNLLMIWVIGCADNPVVKDSNMEGKDANRKITVNQTGGFAGVSKTISIVEDKDSVILISEDNGQRNEMKISKSDFDQLWNTLESNEIFALKTNVELQEKVKDGFSYKFEIERGKKHNLFSVYAPDLLVSDGEPRYDNIIKAIENLTKTRMNEDFIIADMLIEDVSVSLLESFPVQVHISVKGILNDGCTELNNITQKREGNTIYVHITTKRPKDAICIQVIKPFEENIALKGGFPPGKYKLIVNNFEKVFEVQ